MRWLIAGLFIAASAPAFAQEPLAKVYACADIADGAARLACFDGAVAGLKKDVAGGQVQVMSKEQVRAAEIQTFGSENLTVSTALAAASGRKPAEAPPDRVTLKVKSITPGGDGNLRFLMENGQLWRQMDREKVVGLGSGPWTAEVRKAAMGTFFMNIEGRRAIRVKRVD